MSAGTSRSVLTPLQGTRNDVDLALLRPPPRRSSGLWRAGGGFALLASDATASLPVVEFRLVLSARAPPSGARVGDSPATSACRASSASLCRPWPCGVRASDMD